MNKTLTRTITTTRSLLSCKMTFLQAPSLRYMISRSPKTEADNANKTLTSLSHLLVTMKRPVLNQVQTQQHTSPMPLPVSFKIGTVQNSSNEPPQVWVSLAAVYHRKRRIRHLVAATSRQSRPSDNCKETQGTSMTSTVPKTSRTNHLQPSSAKVVTNQARMTST